MAAKAHQTVAVVSNTGGMKSLLDGVYAQFSESSWARVDYIMPGSYHIQGLRVRWKNASTGDYGYLCVINPINGNGYVNPSVAVVATDTTVDLGDAAVAANFDPANGAVSMEFWSDDDSTLVECRGIASVSGTVVTLTDATTSAHTTSARIRCILDRFSPIRGTDGISSGFHLLAGDGVENIRSESNYTDLIPVGVILSARFKTTSGVGQREITINYRFREPEA